MAILLPRSFSSSVSRAVVSSRPPKRISPSTVVNIGLCRPRMVRLVTDFPEPDSPTIPSVLPRATSKESPSTARTMPSSVLKLTCRSRTESSGPASAGDGTPASLVRVVTTVLLLPGLGEPHARVDEGVGGVDDDVEQQDHGGGEQHHAEQQRQVAEEH